MKSIFFNSRLDHQASGKGRKFSILAYSGGLLRVDGFSFPVVVDLAGLQASAAVPIILDHSPSTETTIGQTSDIRNDGKRLVLAGQVTGKSQRVQDVIAQHDAGYSWQASIGCSVELSQDVPAGQRVSVNGQTFVGPVIVARRTVLRETSVLPVGADATTQVNLAAKAASIEGKRVMKFEDYVISLGLDPATLTPEAAAALKVAFENQPEPADGAPALSNPQAAAAAVLNLRATATAELRRHAEINARCVGFPHIAATAIDAGWSPLETENHVLKARFTSMTPSNFRSGSGHSGGITKNTLSASLMLRAGGESVAVKAFGADVCQQARDLRCSNLNDLAAHALTLAGHDPRSYPNNDQMLRAAFSTSSLPSILGDSVGKSLVAAYEETTSEWKTFCHIGNAESFRDQKGVRPAAIASLEEVGAAGKVPHGNLREEDTFTWHVATFAKMLSVTRHQIVNDDLGFISELSPMLGTAAGRSLNDLIWETILGGQTANYFSSGNANLATTASALSVSTLGAAVAAMRNQRDDNGYDLNISPVALVVPPALEMTARSLLNSAEVLGTSGVNGNPVQGIVPNLIVEPRISNTTRFANATAIQWFLFGAPKDRAITVGFLKGQQTPTIETADTDFNTLGIQLRVYHDYGVALADPRGAYKAVGTAP